MSIRVLFFGILRDVTGIPEERLELPEGSALQAVFEHYAARFPRLGGMSSSIVLALNREFAPRSASLSDGDEVALLPPVSGGSGPTHETALPEGHFFALTRDPIDASSIARRIQRGEDGAVVNFEGVARNNTKGRPTLHLDYECYEPMALKIMTEIGAQIAGSFAIGRIAMVHRLGRIEIGETSVAVIACAPHRRAAFEAALEGINRLKRMVPIWKKEQFVDGELWVDGEWDEAVLRKARE